MTGNSSNIYCFKETIPEYVAVLLATKAGSRLEPLTNETPKHLLPIAGVPIVLRLLHTLELAGFTECIVGIAPNDRITASAILQNLQRNGIANNNNTTNNNKKQQSHFESIQVTSASLRSGIEAILKSKQMKVTIVRLVNDSVDSTKTEDATTTGAADGSTATTATPSTQEDSEVDNNNATTSTSSFSSSPLAGSAEALRRLEATNLISPLSHLVVLPADLVLLESGENPIAELVNTHRTTNSSNNNNAAACTMLLADVGEVDEHTGVPLKESAKQKKGGFARDEEDIEYIALTYNTNNDNDNNNDKDSNFNDNCKRVVWKESKMAVEEDKDMVGATPKLILPKARLVSGITAVRTDWNDVHVYVLSPWVRKLIMTRSDKIVSVQKDLIPLLINRQFKGIASTFGLSRNKQMEEATQDVLEDIVKLLMKQKEEFQIYSSSVLLPLQPQLEQSNTTIMNVRSSATAFPAATSSSELSSLELPVEFSVQAHVVKSVLRSSSVLSYLYANKEAAHQVSAATYAANANKQDAAAANRSQKKNKPVLFVPEGTSIKSKFHSIVLPDTTVGDKVTFKSAVIGRNCQLGAKCRLNNVVILDGVTVGENTILQNTVVGACAKIAENCNLNDCTVAPHKQLAAGTKGKRETYLVEGDHND